MAEPPKLAEPIVPMSDEDRAKLMKKMDDDLEAFIAERKAARAEAHKDDSPYDKSVDQLYEELKKHPAFMTEIDPSEELSPEMQGLQQLKYESDSNETNADSYKEDGNYNFKMKKYRWAIENYTKGINEKCRVKELNAILYSNRAAAQFHIGNHRSAFTDTILCRKFKPDHIKAIYRGAECLVYLKQFELCCKWCDDGLLIAPKDQKFLDLRTKAAKMKKEYDRDHRKAAMKERKLQEQQKKLVQTIKDRGIQLAKVPSKQEEDSLFLSSLESKHPSGAAVQVDSNGVLYWPVLFVYPEYTQTDLIESFDENTRFSDHIDAMFGEQVPPAGWDEQSKYKSNNINIYFEDREKEHLHPVKTSTILSEVLQHKKYVVHGGTPSFILIVKDSPFAKHFLAKYKS